MEAPNASRLPLLELSLEPYLEGGPKGPTPRGKPFSLKRARSPAPSSCSTPQGHKGWLSPSKRRVLSEEGLLPRSQITTTPGRRLFPHVDDVQADDLALRERPVGRTLFSARDVEPGVTVACPASHINSTTSGSYATGCGSTPSHAMTTANVKLLSPGLFGAFATRDDATVVNATSLSSPATLAPSPLIIYSHESPQAGHKSTTPRLEPSPDIKVAVNTPTTTSYLVPALEPALVIKKSSPHVVKIDIPPTYSSNPAVPLDALALQFTRPTLEDSMTFVQGSKHYPGFVVRTDTPSPSRASSSSSSSSRSTASAVSPISDVPPDSECGAIDEEDEDKENAAAVFVAAQRMKRRKLATPSREGTHARDNVSKPAPEVSPPVMQTPERASKRARTAAASLLPRRALFSDTGRDAMPRQEGRRRMDIDIDAS